MMQSDRAAGGLMAWLLSIDQSLLDARDGEPSTEMTEKDWEDIRRDGRARIAALQSARPPRQ